MATLYNIDGILGNHDLLYATISRLFVDLKDAGDIPNAELRLVLAEDHIDRWNCSIGSNPGAAVNANSPYDITFGVQPCPNPPANILMSFEFKPRMSYWTLISLIDCLRGGGSSSWENLLRFARIGLRGGRDIVFQWLLRLNRLNIINHTADTVVDTSRLGILGEPHLELGKFIAKRYSRSGWGILQSNEDIEIHRGWFEFECFRARGINDTPHPYVSPDEDVDHKAKSGA